MTEVWKDQFIARLNQYSNDLDELKKKGVPIASLMKSKRERGKCGICVNSGKVITNPDLFCACSYGKQAQYPMEEV